MVDVRKLAGRGFAGGEGKMFPEKRNAFPWRAGLRGESGTRFKDSDRFSTLGSDVREAGGSSSVKLYSAKLGEAPSRNSSHFSRVLTVRNRRSSIVPRMIGYSTSRVIPVWFSLKRLVNDPSRSIRPIRCSIWAGFQTRSWWTMRRQCLWRSSPSCITSLAIRIIGYSWDCSDAIPGMALIHRGLGLRYHSERTASAGFPRGVNPGWEAPPRPRSLNHFHQYIPENHGLLQKACSTAS